jgi:tripartite-type tricarboxylate transporter receptor subunit TctC
MNFTRRQVSILAAAAVAAFAPLVAAAQPAGNFPTRPVRIVVPTPAGGPSDTAARLLAQALSTSWGQQVVVENRAGASGALAAQAVMASPADGYTLLWGQASMAGLPFLQKNAPFRNLGDLAPVSTVLSFGYALFVNRDLPVSNFADLVAHGRANPGKLSFATGTLGEYMMAAHVLKSTGISAIRVPYKGAAQLMPDLVSGQVQINFGPILGGLQHVKTGRLKMLATALPQRSAQLPDVPTLVELGVQSGNVATWNAVFAPPGTPSETTERIAGAISLALKAPAVRTPLEQAGAEPLGGTPQQLARDVEAATAAWRVFVRDYEIPQE